MDRYDFERALNGAAKTNAENEALIIESYIGAASTGSKAGQQNLFNSVNKTFKKNKCPWQGVEFTSTSDVKQQPDGRLWISKMDADTFREVFKYLMLNKNEANSLLNIGRDDNGIGAGEIMLAYIVENIKIGGGSADTDLELFDEKWSAIKPPNGKCELKEAQLSKGMLANWRTGAKHQGINSTYVPQLTAIYDAVKHNIEEIKPDGDGKDLAAAGGWINEWGTVGGKRFKHIQNLTKKDIQTLSSSERDFKIGPGAKDNGALVIKSNGVELGKLSDPKTAEKIKSIIKTEASVRTFTEIQDDVISAVGDIPTPFLFIESKNKSIVAFHYYEKLPGKTSNISIHSITQGKFKYKIKPNRV
jgi:hypothetical protein|tara:strand:+ start:31 stop:1110 length:1080 start_codon:yes stop_codon:yes gene_type:complete